MIEHVHNLQVLNATHCLIAGIDVTAWAGPLEGGSRNFVKVGWEGGGGSSLLHFFRRCHFSYFFSDFLLLSDFNLKNIFSHVTDISSYMFPLCYCERRYVCVYKFRKMRNFAWIEIRVT